MYLVFYKTNDVFAAEELLQNIGIAFKTVPTPVQDKAYCGVCIKIGDADVRMADEVLACMAYQSLN